MATVPAFILGAALETASAAPVPQDLGAVASTAPLTATVWLKPHDPARFAEAVDARMRPGSPFYHHWMSEAEIASYDATSADVDQVAETLRGAGLTVVARDPGGAFLKVRASAAAVEAAFHLSLHNFRVGNRDFHAALEAPSIAGAAGAMVAGVTGLDNEEMRPFIARQLDPATGAPLGVTLVNKAAGLPIDLSKLFTNACFENDYQYDFTRFLPGVGGVEDNMVGPRYIGTGFAPDNQLSCGYTAKQMQAHYGMGKLYAEGLTGRGKTIVIVDAYGSPTVEQDANLFSSEMGLPKLDAKNFSVVYPDGLPTVSPYTTGWPAEVSLDVEWAHAIAPGAKIVLVVAPTADDSELATAVHYAVKNNLGDVISNSYGEPEAEVGVATARAYDTEFRRAAAKGIAVFVATGDSGDFGVGTPVGAASIPADSPYATGVGGTSLAVPSDAGPVDSVWGLVSSGLANQNRVDDPPAYHDFVQGGGGGQSLYLEKPSWQKALPGVGRQLPDISAMADPLTGAILFLPTADGANTQVAVYGGTSLATPLMAGLWAIADQAAGARLGQAAPIIARMPAKALTDIQPVIASAYDNNNLSGTIRYGSETPVPYLPADLLDLTATQPNGFVGTLGVFIGAQVAGISYADIGFGADSSLMAAPGWDNATGYGTPIGPQFVAAAKAAAWR